METWAASVLRVSPTATHTAIEKALREHPHNLSNDVQKAYVILSSPFLRGDRKETMARALDGFHYAVESIRPT